MKILGLSFPLLIACNAAVTITPPNRTEPAHALSLQPSEDPRSWTYFLRHLPVVDGPIVDYRGHAISYQQKHTGIIPYDVGKSDLQQCADALIRLRAEYLFAQKRYSEIAFHFVVGPYYSWNDYCKGSVPVPEGNGVRFVAGSPHDKTHASLRKYLDLVYIYASTISLARELKPAAGFAVGTVLIHPGSPGHCSMIIDEREDQGKKLYKLAEGYTPAQSIYVLRNLQAGGVSSWYALQKGTIRTASYTFDDYLLRKFE